MEAYLYNCRAEFAARFPILLMRKGYRFFEMNRRPDEMLNATGELQPFIAKVGHLRSRVTLSICTDPDPAWRQLGPGDARIMLIPEPSMVGIMLQTSTHDSMALDIDTLILNVGGHDVAAVEPPSYRYGLR